MLTDFRSYARAELASEGRIAVLTGPNGAGKTNLLEAISFLAPGRGLRRAQLEKVGRQGSDGFWAVAATLATPNGSVDIGTGLEDGEARSRRVVRIDGIPKRSQALLGQYLAVSWLTPQMDRLFLEGSKDRRRFFDRMVFGFDPEHAARLAEYDHAQRERGRLLREGRIDRAWLSALEETMARQGVAVAASRRVVLARIAAAAEQDFGLFPAADLALAGDLETELDQSPALTVEEGFRARLARTRSLDREGGGSTAGGPHRTDLLVTHRAKAMPAAQCSTGEQKALLITLCLANARVLEATTGTAPLLLLDEVAAHLDEERRAGLFTALEGLPGQSWLTGTDAGLFAPLGDRAEHFEIRPGAIRKL